MADYNVCYCLVLALPLSIDLSIPFALSPFLSLSLSLSFSNVLNYLGVERSSYETGEIQSIYIYIHVNWITTMKNVNTNQETCRAKCWRVAENARTNAYTYAMRKVFFSLGSSSQNTMNSWVYRCVVKRIATKDREIYKKRGKIPVLKVCISFTLL